MTRKKKCNSQSNSFVAAAEQVCLQSVLEHRQRRDRRNIAWQAIPHLCSSNRKGMTSDSWPTTGRNVKLFSGGGPEPASVRHVGDTFEWRRQVRWCGTMQSTIPIPTPHLNINPDVHLTSRCCLMEMPPTGAWNLHSTRSAIWWTAATEDSEALDWGASTSTWLLSDIRLVTCHRYTIASK